MRMVLARTSVQLMTVLFVSVSIAVLGMFVAHSIKVTKVNQEFEQERKILLTSMGDDFEHNKSKFYGRVDSFNVEVDALLMKRDVMSRYGPLEGKVFAGTFVGALIVSYILLKLMGMRKLPNLNNTKTTGICEVCSKDNFPEKDLVKIDSGQLLCPNCLKMLRE